MKSFGVRTDKVAVCVTASAGLGVLVGKAKAVKVWATLVWMKLSSGDGWGVGLEGKDKTQAEITKRVMKTNMGSTLDRFIAISFLEES